MPLLTWPAPVASGNLSGESDDLRLISGQPQDMDACAACAAGGACQPAFHRGDGQNVVFWAGFGL